MNKKLPIYWPGILMILCLMVAPLIYTHTCSPVVFLTLLTYTFCLYVIGRSILQPVRMMATLLPLSAASISVLAGSIVFSLVLFFTGSTVIVSFLLLLISCALCFRSGPELTASLTKQSIFAFLISLLVFVLISSFDLYPQFSSTLPNHNVLWSDRYYFTSIVSTIRKGTIFSAAYETNTPLCYGQLLGFLFPALMANVLHISSHQALWGIAQPFYKFVAILLCYDVCYFFVRDKVSRNNYLFIFLALSLPILLAPLHPLYVMKGVLKNFMLICMAYIFPNGMVIIPGTVTWPIAFILLLFGLLLFADIDWKQQKFTAEKVIFSICVALMAAAKVPVFVSFGAFIGAIITKRFFVDKEKISNYLWYMLGSLLLAFILLKFSMGKSAAIKNEFRYGYLADLIAQGYKRSHTGLVNNLIIIALLAFSYVAWTSIRLVGLAALLKSKMPLLREFFTGTIVCIISVTLLASFWHMLVLDKNGKVVDDGCFDVQQYILAGFYLVSIVATIGMLYFFYTSQMKKVFLYGFYGVTTAWCVASTVALVAMFREHFYVGARSLDCPQYNWYADNVSELQTGKYNDGLIAVNPAGRCYGIMLASSDFGTYWTAMGRNVVNGNYNWSTQNEYRWGVFKILVDSEQVNALMQMKNEGVKYIISTPDDSLHFARVSDKFPDHLQKIKETKWIYQVR